MRLTLILCVLLACAACGYTAPLRTYSGPALAAEQQARIVGWREAGRDTSRAREGEMLIICVDGVSTQKFILVGPPIPSEVLVTPGRHYVRARYQRRTSSAEGTLWLDAEAGRTYELNFMIRGYGAHFWLSDALTGTVVGGAPGREVNPAPAEQRCT